MRSKKIDIVLIILALVLIVGIIGLVIYMQTSAYSCLADPVAFYKDHTGLECTCIDLSNLPSQIDNSLLS